MLIEHGGKRPQVAPCAWVAPDATICGDVVLGPGVRVLHGARIIGEAGGSVRIGHQCIIMENAVVRATPRHSCSIGENCLIGPNAHVTGAVLEDQVFIATSAAVFHGSHLGRGSEVRIHGTVHLRTRLEPNTTVPIGWIAVGDPARILPPEQHEAIWAIQKPLNFPQWVYGMDRDTPDLMVRVTASLSDALGSHQHDTVLDDSCPSR